MPLYPGSRRLHRFVGDSLLEGTGFEPSVPRQEKWSMPSSGDQTRVGRTLTLGGGAESSLEGRDIELSVSPKDIRTSPYDLCANRSDRRQSREGDRWFESTSLQRRVRSELLPVEVWPALSGIASRPKVACNGSRSCSHSLLPAAIARSGASGIFGMPWKSAISL